MNKMAAEKSLNGDKRKGMKKRRGRKSMVWGVCTPPHGGKMPLLLDSYKYSVTPVPKSFCSWASALV